MTSTSPSVAVVGAGPYGLSVSAHLTARGVPHRVLGRPMSLWAGMPRGMFLKSEGHASNISDPAGASTLRRFAREHDRPYADLGLPVPLDLFTDYGHWFQRREVPHLEVRDVVSLARSGRGFAVSLSDGTALTADRVVLAVGVGSFAHLPDELVGLPDRLVTHSSAHRDFTRLSGQDVIVVGGGQSALETAVLLAEAGARPHVLVRGGVLRWNPYPVGRSPILHPLSGLGTGWRLLACARLPGTFHFLPGDRRVDMVRRALGPAGGWWLRDRFEGAIPVMTGTRIVSARPDGDGVELTLDGPDGAGRLRAQHVVAGTGYRVDLTRLSFLDDSLRAGIATLAGFPVLSRRFESTEPGLFFVGLAAAAAFGPVQRFVCGSGFAARTVTSALSARRLRGSGGDGRSSRAGDRWTRPGTPRESGPAVATTDDTA
jgi:NADPH-dependent 2,4-dienoyl-CoA reductase/sulfur reductase-like enzyme